jgi:hypothetical protein
VIHIFSFLSLLFCPLFSFLLYFSVPAFLSLFYSAFPPSLALLFSSVPLVLCFPTSFMICSSLILLCFFVPHLCWFSLSLLLALSVSLLLLHCYPPFDLPSFLSSALLLSPSGKLLSLLPIQPCFPSHFCLFSRILF